MSGLLTTAVYTRSHAGLTGESCGSQVCWRHLEPLLPPAVRTHWVAVARVAACPRPPAACVSVCLSSRGSMTCTTELHSSSTTWATACPWQPSWVPSCFSWPCGESTSPLLFLRPPPPANRYSYFIKIILLCFFHSANGFWAFTMLVTALSSLDKVNIFNF